MTTNEDDCRKPCIEPTRPAQPKCHEHASRSDRTSREVPSAPLAPKLRPLNGQFLSSYDTHLAEADRYGALVRYRREFGGAADTHLVMQAREGCADKPGPELILDDNNLLPFSFLRTGDRLGRAVVKLQRGDGSAGTGFLVAPGILLTNHHVLPDVKIAEKTTVHANYEASPPADSAGRAAVVNLDPASLFITNLELDFTFCAVKGLEHLGFVPLERDSLSVVPSESVNIIQHPRGRYKEVALQDNRVVKVDNLVMQYCCDTEPGSSGSPVFNNNWHLVALHHASVVVDHKDGGRCACGTDPDSRFLNEGIRLSAIAVWLETTAADRLLGRESANRVRSLFRGLDPQIGFFGALGRHIHDKLGPEAVVECYHARHGHLDLAFWDLGPLLPKLAHSLELVCWFIASSGIDVWCLSNCDEDLFDALRGTLQTGYRLDYQILPSPHREETPMGMLVRRTSGLNLEWLGATDGPLRVLLRAGTRKKKPIPIQFIPIVRGNDNARKRIDSIIREVSDSQGSALILLGDGLLSRSLHQLSALFPRMLAAFGNDGGLALLSGNSSWVGPVYVGPNLDLTIGSSQDLVVARDRRWPPELEELGRSRPLALRLELPQSSVIRNRADAPHQHLSLRDIDSTIEGLQNEADELEAILCHILARLRAKSCRKDPPPATETAPHPLLRSPLELEPECDA